MYEQVTEKKSNGVNTGHILIYPLDAVLVPMRPVVPSHPFIRRFTPYLIFYTRRIGLWSISYVDS
jgi:hypothetical protein